MATTSTTAIHPARPRKLLVVEREPTPYKADLWNACAADDRLKVQVLFSTERDWSPDLGHFYEEFPAMRFSHDRVPGRGMLAPLRFARIFFKHFIQWRPDAVFVAGYSHLPGLLAVAACVLTRTPYFMVSDAFNTRPAKTAYGRIRHALRDVLRRFILRTTDAVLVCGARGRDSALAAGCPSEKVVDFPYVVDVQRLLRDAPPTIPKACHVDLESGKTIIFFSGRMIPRKGLATLLEAVAALSADDSWILWCEGEGPERSRLEQLARDLAVAERCRFLGFCQMSLHSWLIRNAHIVVVPSLDDRWGIVVDEGMQLGKAVVSTVETGSAMDRILNSVNGIVAPAGDAPALATAIGQLLQNNCLVSRLCAEAQRTAAQFSPARNSDTVHSLISAGSAAKTISTGNS